jgi:hypothetical protein
MTPHELFGQLPQAARDAPPEELPALLGKLTEAEAVVRQRLMSPASSPQALERPADAEQWITPDEAARIACVWTKDGAPNVGRIYAWAAGQRWASRPSRRCLRINAAGFKRWLASRG